MAANPNLTVKPPTSPSRKGSLQRRGAVRTSSTSSTFSASSSRRRTRSSSISILNFDNDQVPREPNEREVVVSPVDLDALLRDPSISPSSTRLTDLEEKELPGTTLPLRIPNRRSSSQTPPIMAHGYPQPGIPTESPQAGPSFSPPSPSPSSSALPPPNHPTVPLPRSASPSRLHHKVSQSNPQGGYTENDIIPLSLTPPATGSGLSLAIPPPILSIQGATPLTPRPTSTGSQTATRIEREMEIETETYDVALVRTSRQRMSDKLLAERKERRRSRSGSNTPDLSTEEMDANSGQIGHLGGIPIPRPGVGPMSRSGSSTSRIQVDKAEDEAEEAEASLEDWEKELRALDAEAKIRTWVQSRKRDSEFKDWERQRRSEIARRSILGQPIVPL